MKKYIFLLTIILILFVSCEHHSTYIFERSKIVDSRSSAIKILQNPPAEQRLIVVPNKQWEKGISFPSICKNSSTGDYFMYYGAWTYDADIPFVNCVMISRDGLNWQRPQLSKYKWKGENCNIIFTEYENITVSYIDGLFYLLGYKHLAPTEIRISKDGINFSEPINNIDYMCDSANQILKKIMTGFYTYVLGIILIII